MAPRAVSQLSHVKSKGELLAARSELQTVDEYVGKMRNRVDYLANEETRMNNKIERMHDIMAKRENILLAKWEDQQRISEEHTRQINERENMRLMTREALLKH